MRGPVFVALILSVTAFVFFVPEIWFPQCQCIFVGLPRDPEFQVPGPKVPKTSFSQTEPAAGAKCSHALLEPQNA